MSDYTTLRNMTTAQGGHVMVDKLELAELLAEFDALLNRVAKPAGKYPPDFEEAWSLYPARPGASKQATFKAWAARIKAGTTALEMIEGTVKYAAYCKAERKEGEYIKLPATFYGPGEHFAADWTSTKKAAPAARDDLIQSAMLKRRGSSDTFMGETIDV